MLRTFLIVMDDSLNRVDPPQLQKLVEDFVVASNYGETCEVQVRELT